MMIDNASSRDIFILFRIKLIDIQRWENSLYFLVFWEKLVNLKTFFLYSIRSYFNNIKDSWF